MSKRMQAVFHAQIGNDLSVLEVGPQDLHRRETIDRDDLIGRDGELHGDPSGSCGVRPLRTVPSRR